MYLSVDVDFWNCLPLSDAVTALTAMKKSGKIRAKVDNHKDLIPSVNASGCTSLVNVDTHSDIIALEDIERLSMCRVNCGNWTNHIDPKLRRFFEWVYPMGEGKPCDWRARGLDPRSPDIFAQPKAAGWRSIRKRAVTRFPLALIEKATDIGIAVSYYYLEGHIKEHVRELFKDVFGHTVRHTSKDCW